MPPLRQRNKASDWLRDKETLGRATGGPAAPPQVVAPPWIIAHRGASGHAPENTLSAFLLAAEMGADAIELDVHLAADGKVVVLHNDTVDATTDGHGQVSQMTVDELKALDAGTWYDARYAGERIPTLAEVFEAIGQRLLINVEIKVGPSPGATQVVPSGQLETEVVRLVEAYGMTQRVLISSFSPKSLRTVHRLCPIIPLAFLYARSSSIPALLLPRVIGALIVPYDALHPAANLVDAPHVAAAHQRGLLIQAWTVNGIDDMQRMQDLGVDGIITNYPDRLSQMLAER